MTLQKHLCYICIHLIIGLQQSTKSEAALKFLIQVGYQSKAKTFLMNVGSMAIAAEAKRLEAKKNLLRRSIKARRWNLYREEARKFLLYCGRYVIHYVVI